MEPDPLARAAALLVLGIFLTFVVWHGLDPSRPIPKELGPMATVALGFLLYGLKKNGGKK